MGSLVARHLDSERSLMREIYGQVIAAERAKHHGELAELKAALEERIDALAAELCKQRGDRPSSFAILESPLDPDVLALLRYARVCDLKQLAAETAEAAAMRGEARGDGGRCCWRCEPSVSGAVA
jgi:hypothetical protein